MRILHVLAALDGGGVEALLKSYYSHMDHQRFQFDFVVHGTRKGFLERWFEQQGCTIYRVPPKSLNPLLNLIKLRKIIAAGHYDVVHVHQGVMSAFPLMFAKSSGVPVRIAHSHIAAVDKKKPLEGWLRKKVLESATHLVACSQEAGAWLFGPQVQDSKRFFLLPNAIEVEPFDWKAETREKVRAQMELRDRFTIGMVARFTSQKNHVFFLEIAAQIVKQREDAVCLLVGDGPLKGKIEKQAQEMGLSDHIRFLGKRMDVGALMQAMDCFLLPSLYEGFGLVLLEAQASGLVCFTSKDVVPEAANVTGLVRYIPLEAGGAAWCEQMLHTDLPERKSWKKQIAEQGYDIREQAEKLELCYQQWVASAGRNGGASDGHAYRTK